MIFLMDKNESNLNNKNHDVIPLSNALKFLLLNNAIFHHHQSLIKLLDSHVLNYILIYEHVL